jgi:outer membrane immunogenic protein
MRVQWFLVSGFGFLMGLSQVGLAQKGEVSGNFSYVHYNPAKSLGGSRDLSGGGGSIGFNLRGYLTVKGEFQTYRAATFTYHLPSSVNAVGGTYESKGNMFTYLFGPQFNFPMVKNRFFGEALFGGADTDAYANLFNAAHVTGISAHNNGFAMVFGGGLDYEITRRVGIRPVQFDYFLTRYEWKPLGINNQSNFRYQAGLVYMFGRM